MAKSTLSTSDWDDVCPRSCKDSAFNTEIKEFLKLVPSGVASNIKTLDGCDKAETQRKDLLGALDKMLKKVIKAKDNPQNAGKLLTGWIVEVKEFAEEIDGRRLDLIDEMADPLTDELTKQLDGILKEVTNVTAAVKKADHNIGHSEQMREQALFSMVTRAGTLRETGHEGTKPKDFLDDVSFKGDYHVWDEQVDLGQKSTKILEGATTEQQAVLKKIREMDAELKKANTTLTDHFNSGAKGIAEFKKAKEKIHRFTRELDTKYATFTYIPSFTSADDVRREAETDLDRRFVKIRKVDAEAYYEEEMRKYGFNERQLDKAVKGAMSKITQVRNLMGIIPEMITEGANTAEEMKSLNTLRDELVALRDKYVRGRANQEIAQALSKEVNAGMKKEIDDAMTYFGQVADEATKAANTMKGRLATAGRGITLGGARRRA